MGDKIYRQDALDCVDKRIQQLSRDPEFIRKRGDIDLYGIKPMLLELPSAETEIIKCKDCKWWNSHYRECQSPNWNTGTDEFIMQPSVAYCSWGEGKDGFMGEKTTGRMPGSE